MLNLSGMISTLAVADSKFFFNSKEKSVKNLRGKFEKNLNNIRILKNQYLNFLIKIVAKGNL